MVWFRGHIGRYGFQAVLLLLLLTFVFPGVFLRGEYIAPGDLLFPQHPWSFYAPEDFSTPQNPLMPDIVTAFLPYYSAASFAVEAGEWPLWNPYEFGGMPLMANCQSAVFYPPRILHYVFGLGLGQTLYVLLKLWLCGMVAYGCAAVLGLGRGWDRLFSVLWMLGSYNLIWCNWSLPDVSIWLPLLVAGVDLILVERYRRGFFCVCLSGSGLLLAGHPETAFMMAFGVGVYFVFRLLFDRIFGVPMLRRMGVCLGAWGVVLLVTAPQWLPFVSYLMHSYTFFERATQFKDDYFTTGSLVQFWVPRFYGTWYDGNFWGQLNSNILGMVYTGLVSWMGLVLLFSLWREERRLFRRALAAVLAMGVGLCAAFGLPAVNWVHELPVFSSALKPYHAVFMTFVLPLFGVLGLQAWFAKERRVYALWPCVLLIAGVCVLVGGVYGFNAGLIRQIGASDFLKRELMVGFGVACGLVVVLVVVRRVPVRVGVALLMVVGAGDLLYANRGLNVTTARKDFYPETALTTVLKDLGHPVRIGLGEGFVPAGLMVPYGIEDWLAYDGLYPESMMRFQVGLGRDVWESMEPVCAKDYYLHFEGAPYQFPVEEQPERFERVGTYDGLSLYKNKGAFSRAFLVGGLELVSERRVLFEGMSLPGFDPEAMVVAMPTSRLAYVPDVLLGNGKDVGEARITSYRSTEVVIEVEALQESVLVLADTYMPGWHVTVDGEAGSVFPAYYAFRGVVVPEGSHTVRFTYWPWTLTVGLMLSVVGMVLSLGIAWRTRSSSEA